MQPAALFQSFDGDDRPALNTVRPRHAGTHRATIDKHRARTALSLAATVFCPDQIQFVAQHTEQASLTVDFDPVFGSIDLKLNDSHRSPQLDSRAGCGRRFRNDESIELLERFSHSNARSSSQEFSA
jgi:hypothetical protein